AGSQEDSPGEEMKGTAGLARMCALAIAAMATTAGLAQERALSPEGQHFMLRRMELSHAHAAGHQPMSHSRVCSVNMQPGFASCHAHVVKDEKAMPFATTGPAGYAPADLRAAYSVTGMGSSATVIAV